MFMGPSQAKLSGPALTSGAFTIFKIRSSEIGAVQGLFPEAVSVKVTVPFKISDAPGIYVVVKELEDVNVPSPDRVQAYVLGTPSVTDTWPGENV